MKLTAADRGFVAALAGTRAPDVLAILEERSDVLIAMGGGVKERSLGQDLLDWCKLAGRVARSSVRRADSRGFDSIVLDRTPKALPGRLEYVRRFRPQERLTGVTATTSLLWPGVSASLRVLWALLKAVISADRREPSELTYRAVQVATACLQAVSYGRRASLKRAYLFRPYRLESPIVAAALMEQGVDVGIIVGTTPLAAHIRRLVASSAVLCTAYQLDEVRALRPLGDGRHELWGPTELVQMEAAYGGRSFSERPGDVGVYTQGFWVRLLLGSIDAESGAPHRALEQRFLDIVTRYAETHPDVRVHLFPHPMERTRFRETGEHGFGELLDLPNVEAHFGAEENSILSFDRVGLGLTTVSTIGFDRLHIGLRTLFFVGESDFLDPAIESPFQSLFLTEEDALLDAIEKERVATNADFMARHFDAAYGDEWGPWTGGPEATATTPANTGPQ